jgi:hypothetical protein
VPEGVHTHLRSCGGSLFVYAVALHVSRSNPPVSQIYIKDLKSSNGTFLNGKRLSSAAHESAPFELKTDDIVVRRTLRVFPPSPACAAADPVRVVRACLPCSDPAFDCRTTKACLTPPAGIRPRRLRRGRQDPRASQGCRARQVRVLRGRGCLARHTRGPRLASHGACITTIVIDYLRVCLLLASRVMAAHA